jgi:O-antigen/teichoic acid export membrane protein
MEKSYNSSYLKIYFWKIIRIFTGVLSMTIIIPLISGETSIYGVYALCVSITSFLQYTDLGFLSAGQKYASEYFALNDLYNEIKMLSFVHFIMLVFLLLCIVVILFFSFYPNFIITNLSDNTKIIASKLFLILALTSPMIILLRYAQSVFTIRIQDDIYQKIELVINFLKICYVWFLYRDQSVNIVNYFFLIQLLNLVTIIISFGIIKKLYNYDLTLLFQTFRFDKKIYDKTKNLAASTLISAFSWILFFQIDSFIISKLYGIKAVAIYAIPYFLLTFITNLYNTIYYPFLFRFNHFVISSNYNKLYSFLFKIFELSFPIFILPISILILLMKPLVTGWVGLGYEDSIIVGQVLISSLFFLFINMPYNYLLLSLEKTKILNINSFILPLVFIFLIFILKDKFSLLAVAIAKTSAFMISSLYIYINYKIKDFNFIKFLIKRIIPIIASLLVLFISYYLLAPLLEHIKPKNVISLVTTFCIGFLIFFLSFSTYLFFNKELKDFIKNIFASVFTFTKVK